MTQSRVRFDQGVPDTHAPYRAAADRYTGTEYRRLGDSGLLLPPLSLGFWYNFGDDRPFQTQRDILRYAFDHGINHWDLANNYGPPYGSAEENVGRHLRKDFAPYRHELTITTKAGWDMWPGPYGQLGSRGYLLSSLDASLQRLGLDYVDIFYSHRFDEDTPLEETIGALDTAVRQGKARYVGISSYSAERTEQALDIADRLGTPLVIHQPAYSLLNRWIEGGLDEVLLRRGRGAIAFTALAQGLLTDRYLGDDPVNSDGSPRRREVSDDLRRRLRGLAVIAANRGQSLAQMALAWVLHNPAVVSTLIGVSSVEQLKENLAALEKLDFSDEEITAINEYAGDAGVDYWAVSATL